MSTDLIIQAGMTFQKGAAYLASPVGMTNLSLSISLSGTSYVRLPLTVTTGGEAMTLPATQARFLMARNLGTDFVTIAPEIGSPPTLEAATIELQPGDWCGPVPLAGDITGLIAVANSGSQPIEYFIVGA